MAKFLVTASYTTEGLAGLMKDQGKGRRDAAKKAVAAVGGKLEAFYFTFGDSDAMLIADLPDNVSAAALSIAVGATGLVRTRTTTLLTTDEMELAMEKKVKYRGPGQ